MSDSVSDSAFMERAVSLARLGEGFVEPNPMVGCVIVKDGDIVGEGYDKKFGSAHAEIIAIESAKSNSVDLKGATAYVTLEPCCHFGKTPPCTKAKRRCLSLGDLVGFTSAGITWSMYYFIKVSFLGKV